MADDLDDLLRRSMKTLDDQVPSGYFEALPDRVQARLAGDEGSTMQQTSGTTNREAAAASGGVPPVATRDEDSGLHDIRNLAQSTKQRLSSKRITTSPPVSDDVLATSSASWRNVALPQPANMVSLPAIEDLPSKQEIKAQEKAAKKSAKLEAKVEAPVAPAPVTAVEDPSASQQAAFAPSFSSFAERAKPSHRGRNIALAGMGLAAAAGIGLFVMTQKNGSSDKAAPAVAQAPAGTTTRGLADKTKELEDATAKLQAQRAAAAEQAAKDEAATATGAANTAPAPEETQEPKLAAPATKGAPAKHAVTKTTKADSKVKVEDTVKPAETPKAEGGKKAKPEPGDPSFDELLKEAGVDQKKADKPKLDKKQLSGDDFKKGMAAIQSKAQACFKGTQGTAAVKLTIAPSGQVSKVTVGGVFAGKPEADCVTAAVKSAQFPAWDGGPQSFGYPILLSE